MFKAYVYLLEFEIFFRNEMIKIDDCPFTKMWHCQRKVYMDWILVDGVKKRHFKNVHETYFLYSSLYFLTIVWQTFIWIDFIIPSMHLNSFFEIKQNISTEWVHFQIKNKLVVFCEDIIRKEYYLSKLLIILSKVF